MLTKKQFEIISKSPNKKILLDIGGGKHTEHTMERYHEQHRRDLETVTAVNLLRGDIRGNITQCNERDFDLCVREMSDHAGVDTFVEYLKQLEQRDFTEKVKEIFKPSVKITQMQLTPDEYILGLGDDGVVYINAGYEWRVHTPLVFESSK